MWKCNTQFTDVISNIRSSTSRKLEIQLNCPIASLNSCFSLSEKSLNLLVALCLLVFTGLMLICIGTGKLLFHSCTFEFYGLSI